jgi:uncharacterized protein YciW
MEFIVNQQAQFAANVQAHDERMTRLENIVTRLAEATVTGVERLTNSHLKLEEAQRKTGEAFKLLAESQAHTDKRLRALIDIVREDRKRRNGGNDKS